MAVFNGRILALDLGARRIGLALSDELGLTAQGLPTLVRKNKRQDLQALKQIVEERQVRLVVVGNPLHMSGQQGRQSQNAALFAESLSSHTGVETKLWDERLTSREAERVLRQSGISIAKRGAAVDRLAAVLILQSYLDYLAGQQQQEASL